MVWGSTPVISHSYWSKAMKHAGYDSTTFVADVMHINEGQDWDEILKNKYRFVWRPLKPFVAFCDVILNYDVIFTTCDGIFMKRSPLRFVMAWLLKFSGKKIIVLPYGADSYEYSKIFSIETMQGLMMSYPGHARNQTEISRDVRYWVKNSDAFIPGFMGPDGFGRWDVLLPSPVTINVDAWETSRRQNFSNGEDGKVVVAHSPNHRGFKGTEFLIEAVERLQKEGLEIELIIIEGQPNSRVKEILSQEADILVEQLVASGYALSAIEGMSCGLPVISNLDNDNHLRVFRSWSYLDECPIASASPSSIRGVLRKLVTTPELRQQLGKANREYVEKYHSDSTAVFLFENILDYVLGHKESIINIFHPILGEYPNRSPKIQHPLINNRIVD